jgi:hypothetical protein
MEGILEQASRNINYLSAKNTSAWTEEYLPVCKKYSSMGLRIPVCLQEILQQGPKTTCLSARNNPALT